MGVPTASTRENVEKAISNYEPGGRELVSPAAFNVMKALRRFGRMRCRGSSLLTASMFLRKGLRCEGLRFAIRPARHHQRQCGRKQAGASQHKVGKRHGSGSVPDAAD